MKKWYLVLLKSGKVNALKAKEKLESMGISTFYPLLYRKQMRKDRRNTLRTVSQPLFPGYIFLNFDSAGGLFSKIECCEGVICFVRFGNGPTIIRDSVMEGIIATCFKLGVESVDIVESNIEVMEGNIVNAYDERILSIINEPSSSLKSMKLVSMIHEMSGDIK
ncbi:TPA: hypothetical protein JEL57_004160 [Salmonella enterica subsp. enterica serovar Casablanca]|nr:hypothetical protein [Salmonella enterica subsp. enterica serovar Tanger]EBV4603784.1 hypothetical protein [Salmonella enterica subsp. enterica serovar Tanger]HAU6711776.1 hypothetical protein [Salmonella enterica subsp. enterica serovar Casablanca]